MAHRLPQISDFHGTSTEFAGYLFGISRNLAANHGRRVGRRRTWAADRADLTVLAP